ncbi:MAG: XRE family transcriptional regulator [Saprospiraceae bacterium]|uniref:XRE family transcriptional regulator n=1 Tax=Candidatus Opimibacter skivensis TaxID=2982028 RepID=A0A9D7XSS3_9BACT|nr:XRE family transcriptional regulator [Candidatus Opimibacter skivensis]
MKKPGIVMTITKEDVGYSAYAYIKPYSINTQGDTFEELQEMIIDAVNLSFEEEGFTYTIDEIKFKLDLESFFAFYKVINAKALSKRIGMNQSLLAQYIRGIKKPSPAQTKRILDGVQQIGRELAEIQFIETMGAPKTVAKSRARSAVSK